MFRCRILAAAALLLASQPQPTRPPALPKVDLSDSQVYPVIDIIDGDTIVIAHEYKENKLNVQLLGVSAPKPASPYREESTTFLQNLLRGEAVFLFRDPNVPLQGRDETLYCYIYRWPDGLFVNAEIVRQGYGKISAATPPLFSKELTQLQQFARQAGKGLWAQGESQPRHKQSTEPPITRPKRRKRKADESGGVVYKGQQRTRRWFASMHRKFCKTIMYVNGEYIHVHPDSGSPKPKWWFTVPLPIGTTMMFGRREWSVLQVIGPTNAILSNKRDSSSLIYISGHEAPLVDEQTVPYVGAVVSVGTYEYTTVMGAKKTIPSYCIPRPLTEAEFAEAINSGLVLYELTKRGDKRIIP